MDHALPVPGQEQQFAGRYQIVKKIAAGGHSELYEAYDPVLDRRIALKVLNLSQSRDKQALQQRFIKEYQVISRLKHANIVQVFAFDWNLGQPFIAMELLEGRTLESALAQGGPFNQERFREVFLPLLDAFEYAHQLRLIHRDIKPENIMIMGEFEEVKVLDFGLSSILEPGRSDLTQTSLIGSPYYMSPEQCAGANLDQRSDIYSLACVMYKALLSEPPYKGESAAETMYMHLHAPLLNHAEISQSRKIPKKLLAVVLSALARNPQERPQSMAEFRKQIESALESTGYLSGKSNYRLFRKAFVPASMLLIALLLTAAFIALGKSRTMSALVPTDKLSKRSKKFLRVSQLLDQARALRDSGRVDEAFKFVQDFEPNIDLNNVDRYGAYSIYFHLSREARNLARLKPAADARELLQQAIVYNRKTAAFCDLASRRVEIMGEQLELFDQLNMNELAPRELANVRLELKRKSSEPEPLAEAYWHYYNADFLKRAGDKLESLRQYRTALEKFDNMPFKRTDQYAVLASIALADLAALNVISATESKKELEKTISDLLENPQKSFNYALALGTMGDYLSRNGQQLRGRKLLALSDSVQRNETGNDNLRNFSERVVGKIAR